MLNRNIPSDFFKTLNEKEYYIDEKEQNINLEDNSCYTNYDKFIFSKIYRKYLRNRFTYINSTRYKSNDKVMDICCGVGNTGITLSEKLNTNSIDFVDISEEQLKVCKEKCEEFLNDFTVNIINKDIFLLDKSTKYNLIIGNSFLHHFPDVARYLSKIRLLLKDNGEFIILHEPSITASYLEYFPFSFGVSHLFKKLFNRNYKKKFSTTDLWNFSEKDLIYLFKKSGFTDIKIVKNGFLSVILVNPLLIFFGKNYKIKTFLFTIKVFLEKIDNQLQKILPSFFFCYFLIKAKK